VADVLPPLYQRWLADILPGPVEPERLATCDNCAMLDRSLPPDEQFDPRTKCCTFVPDLPNFLVGRILSDSAPDLYPARLFLQKRIESGASVTPKGIAPLPIYTHVYDARSGTLFGRAPAMRCAFYVEAGGRCGIYAHRESTCSTWFCKHNRAASGLRFWDHMHQTLRLIERSLTFWCIDTGDLGIEAREAAATTEPKLRQLDQYAVGGIANRAIYARIWGHHVGREAEFYRGCARRVEALAWPQILALGGAQLAYHIRMLREIQANLADGKLPERVARGVSLLIQIRTPGTVRMRSPASMGDVLELPTAVANAVGRLEGAPLAEAQAALRADGIDIDDATVRKLLDFQILLPRA
jgi:Fe-S-cluster containining protein